MNYKSGFLGIIGQPNAGKSSLLNFLVDEKVSIVSEKPQTTRRRIIGIWQSNEGQIIFVDAPGIIQTDKGLNGFLAIESKDVIQQSDALIVVLSLDEKKQEDAEQIIKMAVNSGKPWVAVITKLDLVDKIHRLSILKDLVIQNGGKVFTIGNLNELNSKIQSQMSEDLTHQNLANHQKGIDNQICESFNHPNEIRENLLKNFLTYLPDSPAPLYDTQYYTTESIRDLSAEIIREKCFQVLHMEIPYSLAVKIIKFDEDAIPCPKIFAEIILAKENHKGIVIGKNGESLKKIGSLARTEIEKMMGEKIFLSINVAVKKDWFMNQREMKELGYVVTGQ